MTEGAPADDISDRFLDAISRLEEVADAVRPHDAYRQLDETSVQVFWKSGRVSARGRARCGGC
jgi:hypothetical protein